MGIREQNKKYYRQRILNAAREVFSQQGYDNTTIEQIAEKAGVGLGTAYNYFRSKEELFILAVAEDITERAEYEWNEPDSDEQDVVKIVMDTLLHHIGRLKYIPKKIWKVAFPMIWNTMKSDRMPIGEIMRADFKVMDQMRSLLEQLKEKQILDDSFDPNTAVDVIFGSLFLQMTLYIYMKEITFEQTCAKIEADIKFIFEGKYLKK